MRKSKGLTEAEELELLALLEQAERERVSPKLEAFRDPIIGGECPPEIRIRGCRGGRGAGAKSHSLVSLIVQRAHVERLRIGCFREIQESLDESVYALIKLKVEQLGYAGWRFQVGAIFSPCGSKFIFKGLKDLRASRNVKGLEDFDIFFIEEAATISMDSWDLLMPTLMRTPGSQLWFAYNPESESDPVTVKIWNRNRSDAMLIEVLPGPADNPWWNDGLQREMEEDYKADPDEAEHIWGGKPRRQGQRSVMSRVRIREAMDRDVEPVGAEQIGCDVARFGDDRTVMYRRKGLKVVEERTFSKQDTMTIAYELWDMARHDPSIPIYVDDTGVGGGVVDRLRELGANVVPINFGGAPMDKDRYTSTADELWFGFPIDEADIPDDPQLMTELSSRQYSYDSRGRRKIESKDDYKKRNGSSPDKADGLLLTFFQGYGVTFPDEITSSLAERRRR